MQRILAGSVAVVTGGESGIGAATASALKDAGAHVAITYFENQAAAEAICASLGGRANAIAVQTDVTDEASVQTLFSEAERAFGTVTLLVNSANITGTTITIDGALSLTIAQGA